MARYKDSNHVNLSTHEVFDAQHRPGQKSPYPGIYRCINCGKEIVMKDDDSLPPQNHHTHTPQQGDIIWTLLVYREK